MASAFAATHRGEPRQDVERTAGLLNVTIWFRDTGSSHRACALVRHPPYPSVSGVSIHFASTVPLTCIR
jgi:hypothetical protein